MMLKESEFPQHADYVRQFRTCVINAKVKVSDLKMGYLVNSRFIERLSNDAVRRQYNAEVCSKLRSGTPLTLERLREALRRPTTQLVTNSKNLRMLQGLCETPRALQFG